MVWMEYWGTPLITMKLLTYPKWMQSQMNRRLPGCAGHLSGPVTLGNRLLPLLISKRARGGDLHYHFNIKPELFDDVKNNQLLVLLARTARAQFTLGWY